MEYIKAVSVAEYMWGNDAQVFETAVDGICDSTTARHGGFLVDINLHPELKKYGEETNYPNIKAFEEDYEAMKVLWLYPQLLRCPEKADEWLTKENIIKYDKDDSFLREFPERRVIANQENEESEEEM